jgi:hypothetical protein
MAPIQIEELKIFFLSPTVFFKQQLRGREGLWLNETGRFLVEVLGQGSARSAQRDLRRSSWGRYSLVVLFILPKAKRVKRKPHTSKE